MWTGLPVRDGTLRARLLRSMTHDRPIRIFVVRSDRLDAAMPQVGC